MLVIQNNLPTVYPINLSTNSDVDNLVSLCSTQIKHILLTKHQNLNFLELLLVDSTNQTPLILESLSNSLNLRVRELHFFNNVHNQKQIFM